MIPALLLASSLSTFAVSPFQRVAAVTQPCRIRRLGDRAWSALPSRPKLRVQWDLFPGDHIVCTGRGKVAVLAGKTTRAYTDYVALTAPAGLLGGRVNTVLPGAIGLGAARGLARLGLGSKMPDLHIGKLGSGGLDDPSDLAKFNASAAERAAAGLPGAGTATKAEAGAAKAAAGIEAFRAGDLAIVAAIGALMVWLFSAKQWLWLSVAAVVLVAFLLTRKH